MVDFEHRPRYDYNDLVRVVELLRGPGGCPWDAAQTHTSIRRNFIEETCEACEAIDRDDPVGLCEELGDVLLQVLFHASLEAQAGRFTIDDVCDGVVKKLVYRHPHVFGAVQVSGAAEVLDNWEALKRAEKGQQSHTETLQAVCRTLPALWRAEKLQKKAEKAGALPPDAAETLQLLTQQLQLLASRQGTDPDGAQTALGDLLFLAVAEARCLEADPEDLLTAAADRFTTRFASLEAGAETPEPWSGLWPQARA